MRNDNIQLYHMGVINVKKVRALFNNVITTAEKYEEDVIQNGLVVIPKGELKEFQKVVAVGPSARGIGEGDLVKIKLDRHMVKRHKQGSIAEGVVEDNPVIDVLLPKVVINGEDCLALSDIDIDYVVEDYDDEPNCKVVVPPGVGIKVVSNPIIKNSLKGGSYL